MVVLKIIVIGGGPSGLTAALTIKNKNNEVILLEKNNKCGKKLALTGNGQGNYFNEDFKVEHYYSHNKDLLKKIITIENKEKLQNFFKKIGLIPYIKNGWYYPYSKKAISLKEALEKEAIIQGVKIIPNTEVINITKRKKFQIVLENKILEADKVVLATGGLSYPKTGSTGDGYKFLASFGHHIYNLYPVLTSLLGDSSYYKKWQGIRAKAKLSLFIEGKLSKQEEGELQLTSFGISGICTFNLSGLIKECLDNRKKLELFIDFMPFLEDSLEETEKFLTERDRVLKNRTLLELLEAFLDYRLGEIILKNSHLPKNIVFKNLTSFEKQVLITNLRKFSFKVTGVNSFSSAQATGGGLSLEEIDLKTMESKKIRGLYVTGELLDIYGECGGYNLSLAFLTGLLVGDDLNNA